ncbi:cilia- and flagella-associated protein 99 [Engraulis encrasicolus]|uniref:cilia- and flagella-associated protein 99 n=1 Tax=Engraulis encrasicolus TaxID=184585 RepID=UPI002FCF62A3
MTDYKELVKEAATLLDAFKPNEQCLETFIADNSKSFEKKVGSEDARFLLDIISGCIEQKKVLDVVINTFYDQHGKLVLKADYNRFSIVCYLAVFLLEHIGFPRFSKIITSQDVKIHKFLRFLFSVSNLIGWIQSEWSRIYDAVYVEHTWISPLLRWRPRVEELLDQLTRRRANGSLPKKAPPTRTQPIEFDLTKPKPRPLPVPEPIPAQQKHQPVNPGIFKSPKEQQVLEELREKNRLKAQRGLYEANMQQFKCAKPQKSEKTEKLISELKSAQDAELKFDAVFTSGAPSTQKVNSVPIRLNTTSILREGALYNKQLEGELLRLERVAEGSSDPSVLERRVCEQRVCEQREQEALQQRRHLEAQISHQQAALARTRLTHTHQEQAQRKKEETAELMRAYAARRLEEEKGMKELVQQVAEGHQNAKAARDKLQRFKHKIVREECVERREMLARAFEEAQEELAKKMELIGQIRAMEALPRPQHKLLDDTETGGHALLCEMSLAELHERVFVLRAAQQRQLEERRRRIQQNKQQRQHTLTHTLHNIATYRTAMEQAAARRQEERVSVPSVREQLEGDETLQALRRTLEEARQQRQQLTHTQTHTHARTHNTHTHTHTLQQWEERKKGLEEQQWAELEKNLQLSVQQRAPHTS